MTGTFIICFIIRCQCISNWSSRRAGLNLATCSKSCSKTYFHLHWNENVLFLTCGHWNGCGFVHQTSPDLSKETNGLRMSWRFVLFCLGIHDKVTFHVTLEDTSYHSRSNIFSIEHVSVCLWRTSWLLQLINWLIT